jgi:hypothetical protein
MAERPDALQHDTKTLPSRAARRSGRHRRTLDHSPVRTKRRPAALIQDNRTEMTLPCRMSRPRSALPIDLSQWHQGKSEQGAKTTNRNV